MESADGLMIVYARIRHPELRDEFWHRMENLLGERVAPTLYQLNIADWDQSDWDEEIQWISDLLEGTQEAVVVWKFANGTYSRFTVGHA